MYTQPGDSVSTFLLRATCSVKAKTLWPSTWPRAWAPGAGVTGEPCAVALITIHK